MPDDQPRANLAARLRALAGFLNASDVVRLRIEREDEEIELGRRPVAALPQTPAALLTEAPGRLDAIKADLVGIFHFVRPVASEGDVLESDRELAYIEALGIRNPVRSHGGGRIVSVKHGDGDPVEYGAVLFEIDRG
jgi:acetyl/propionyl-CoA carboxylase alpha subunit